MAYKRREARANATLGNIYALASRGSPSKFTELQRSFANTAQRLDQIMGEGDQMSGMGKLIGGIRGMRPIPPNDGPSIDKVSGRPRYGTANHDPIQPPESPE